MSKMQITARTISRILISNSGEKKFDFRAFFLLGRTVK